MTNVCPLNYAKHSKPLLSRVYAGGRDICAILLDVPRCFSAEVALGPFALRHVRQQDLWVCASFVWTKQIAYAAKIINLSITNAMQ